MFSQLMTASLYCFGAFLSAYAAFLVIRYQRPIRKPPASKDADLVYLLREGAVTDANFAGQRILDRITGPEGDTHRLCLYLSRNFDEAGCLTGPANSQGEMSTQSRDGLTQITRRIAGDTVRLRVCSVSGIDPAVDDIHSHRAAENELETLRANTDAAPFLLWRQNSSGEITWANQAYLTAVRTTCEEGRERMWPLPLLFPTMKTTAAGAIKSHRIAFHPKNHVDEAWYDCHVSSVGQDILCTAIPADEAVRSENRRKEFTQTLTKTFAELAIGLAIFDRSRRLVLFNPALLDLTSLPTDLLTSRPSLVSFFDKLRESRVVPEPRDYRAWRASITELEAAAADGTYSETWSLPDGQTYHVTGRPHPDGALAILFEDISAEMSLTRRFRAELDTSHTVIDSFEDAVAVFSAAGRLTLSNSAYRDLWQTDPDDGLVGIGLPEATRHWHTFTNPTPIWGDFRDFAQQTQDREEWGGNATMRDGRSLHCRFVPQKTGSTMAFFRLQTAKPAQTGGELRKAV